jgi:C4-dicarboxylate transporter DctM subunit
MALEYILLLFFLLTFAGVPIAFSIAAVSCIYIVLADLPVLVVGQRMVAGADSFPLLAAPLFMLAGIVMSSGGIMPRLLRLSDALVGHITGGLAQVNVIASLFMAGMSGSATADASARDQ